jgi:hypothetical protein
LPIQTIMKARELLRQLEADLSASGFTVKTGTGLKGRSDQVVFVFIPVTTTNEESEDGSLENRSDIVMEKQREPE